MEGPEGASGVKKKIQKTLILVFEVIVQPPKTHFLTFSSETKIMKITHSAMAGGAHSAIVRVEKMDKIP